MGILHIRYGKWLSATLLLAASLTACNDEDDINAIFVGQTWYLGDFYQTTNWTDDNNQKPIYTGNSEASKLILGNGTDRFYVRFSENTFVAKGTGNTFSGTWRADGKTNTVSFYITQGSPSSGSGLEQEVTRKFYDAFSQAAFYRGNTIWLKFFPEDRQSFMQLTKIRRDQQ